MGAGSIEAVVFDIDGTLLDSVDLHTEAWHRAFEHFGKALEVRRIREQIGKGGDQLLPVFLSKNEIDRFGNELEQFRSDLFKRESLPRVRAFPDVRRLFGRILRDGKKIALASSAKGDELETYKRIAGVADLLDAETSSDDANHSKPHPDIFEAALDKLGNVDAAATLAIGDTPYDSESAGKAGVRTIGVTCGGWSETALRQAGCISVFRDPADLLARYEDSPLCG